ncbi:hypothetical protein [Pedobacter sp. B4-66]|uniref:hypothetical protein n=1 Tax=Pedobacter sp. B4-66 TaxID=2817280 RepID=UPI001BD9F0C4|nr:hypothetical protein [Pedobacter sp. B4-66]
MIDQSNGRGTSCTTSKEQSQLAKTKITLMVIGAAWLLALCVLYISFQNSKSIKGQSNSSEFVKSK